MDKNTEWLRRTVADQHTQLTSVRDRLSALNAGKGGVLADTTLGLKDLRQLAQSLHELHDLTGELGDAVTRAEARASSPCQIASTNGTLAPNRQQLMRHEELALLVRELAEEFEASDDYDASSRSDWTSPSGDTVVVHTGSSASSSRTLVQNPDDVFGEYLILYKGQQVFLYKDYVWPHLVDDLDFLDPVALPIACFDELVAFHRQCDTWWYSQYQQLREEAHLRSRLADADPDALQLVTQCA